jgi:hypothetical protein
MPMAIISPPRESFRGLGVGQGEKEHHQERQKGKDPRTEMNIYFHSMDHHGSLPE